MKGFDTIIFAIMAVSVAGGLIAVPSERAVLAREPVAVDQHPKWTGTTRKHAELHCRQGTAAYATQDYRKAIKEFTLAIRLSPNLAQPFYSRGNTHMRLRQFRAAVEDYENAVRRNPAFVRALANLGNAYSALDRLDESVAAFDKAARLSPDDTYVLFNRGHVQGKRRNFQAAIEDFSKVINREPDNVDALVLRAAAYHAIGELRKAFVDLRAAKAIDPNHPRIPNGP